MSTNPYEHGGIDLYLFSNGIVPVDVGGLERSDFSQLGSWSIHRDNETRTCGYIQRIAVKENFTDEHGDSSRLYIFICHALFHHRRRSASSPTAANQQPSPHSCQEYLYQFIA